ncbi:MAG: SIS domain-containing protein [Cryobacterium sp.]|nr:SIS domain-containing protein [Cryobacterium sp.]MBX3090032.1 SIS domain-containing protein [Cryobacterium sp.]MCC7128323.1 SIS domain-containing protein [Microbacteriaceae bacterium]
MSSEPASAGREYLATVQRLITRLDAEEWPAITQAARRVADALQAGRAVHVFGTGHSHMLAEEAFYRAGGLVNIRPILFEGLMLHANAPLSTSLERLHGLADALIEHHPIHADDVLIAASNSGSNAVTSELVQIARTNGATVIAITSLQHATSGKARATDLPRLHELADIVIDNGGCVGDAAIEIEGFGKKVAPTSTVVGAVIMNMIVALAVEDLVGRGFTPKVYTSSNTAGGDEENFEYLHPVSGI